MGVKMTNFEIKRFFSVGGPHSVGTSTFFTELESIASGTSKNSHIANISLLTKKKFFWSKTGPPGAKTGFRPLMISDLSKK